MQVQVADWWDHMAQPGDVYEVAYLSQTPTTSSDRDAFRTVLAQRPDLAILGITPITDTVIRATVRELGVSQLGPQLGRAVYAGTVAGLEFDVESVVQTAGSTAWTRLLASGDKAAGSVSTSAGNAAIQTTRAAGQASAAVQRALPQLGRDALIAGGVLVGVAALAYGLARRV